MEDQETQVLKSIASAGEPVRPGHVAKETGIDSKEVSKIIKKLKADGKVISPKNCFWAIP